MIRPTSEYPETCTRKKTNLRLCEPGDCRVPTEEVWEGRDSSEGTTGVVLFGGSVRLKGIVGVT